jgi:hypothetical protein
VGALGVEMRLLVGGIGVDWLGAKGLHLGMVHIAVRVIVVTIVGQALFLWGGKELCHLFRGKIINFL